VQHKKSFNPNLPHDIWIKVTLDARSLLTYKSCAGAYMMYEQAEHVLILEHYFTLKSFSYIYEAFSNAHFDKEVPKKTLITGNKISGHRKCLSATSANHVTNLAPI
jgi:hypothetical protein